MLEKIIQNPKISQLVTESVYDSIANRKIKVGDELPSEKELSKIFQISRGSLREGLAILEFFGLIESKKNKRIVIRDRLRTEKILSLFKISGKKDKDIVYDLMELRKIIEPFSVKLACIRADIYDLKSMKKHINELTKKDDLIDTAPNQYFHISIAYATHNSFIALIEELLMQVLNSFRMRVVSSNKRKDEIIREHLDVYHAIKEKNIPKAQQKMIEHLDNVVKNIDLDKDRMKTSFSNYTQNVGGVIYKSLI